MSGSGPETLTAALRRLADEHASGLLTVATSGRDVVLELADGAPVGIGPSHDVSQRVGREAGPSLVAAAVVDGLVDRTVAAIVGGAGAWRWDVASDADMMPVPQGLVTELSRRAVDAAQALATLDPELVLQPGHDLETTGEVDRVRALFDGRRSIEQVAEAADLTVPACATIAAALVHAGVLSTGVEDTDPRDWADTGTGTDSDQDQDGPELWVMDDPDGEPGDGQDPREEATPADDGIAEAMEWVAGDDARTEPAPAAPAAASAPDDSGDTWLDDLDDAPSVRPRDDAADQSATDETSDHRSTLSSMISELQGDSSQVEPRTQAPPARTAEEQDAAPPKKAADAVRKEPKAEPGDVAEFLRELSRLALDEE